MEASKQRIDSLPIDKLNGERKTHPNLSTSGIDVLILEEINSLVKEEVKVYKTKVKNLDLVDGEIKLLQGKEDENSKNRLKELEREKNQKESELKELNDFVNNGDVTKRVVEKIRNKETVNPQNAVKDNLQLVGYTTREPIVVSKDTVTTFIQNLIEKKISNFELRKNFFTKNLNAFDITKKQQA